MTAIRPTPAPADAHSGARSDPALASALRTLSLERAGIAALEAALNADPALADGFVRAVALVRSLSGRLIVSGMGKSGHIGRKLAATLASTGTPAYFVHPGEASHGDLGMIKPIDAILLLSWSGETAELADIITYARRFQIGLIAITSNAASTLAREADIALTLPKSEEACPNGLAPTTSTTMQLAMGDALAVALLEAKGFTAADFRNFHPGGKLGARLTFVADVMHAGAEMPLVRDDAAMEAALIEMTGKRLGCTVVVDDAGRLAGIVTDGDLRRNMQRADLLATPVAAIMTRKPMTIGGDALAVEALASLNETKRTQIVVIDEQARPVGVLHLHDLLHLGVA